MDDYQFDRLRQQVYESAVEHAEGRGVSKVVPFNPQQHADTWNFIREVRRFGEESRKKRLLVRYMVAA